MAHRIHVDDRNGLTEDKFYLPGGVAPSDAGRLERIWVTLFGHRA